MLLGLAGILSLTSCLEIEETIVIAKDGSGTQTVRMNIPRKMIAAMQKSTSAAQAMGAGPVNLLDIYKKKQAQQEFAAAGLTLKKHEVKERRSSDVLRIEAGFDNLQELGASPLGGGRADWILKPAGAGKTALFFFPMGKQAWKEIQLRIKKFKSQPTAPRMQSFFRKKKLEMAGLDITLKLQLPGRVLRFSKNLTVGEGTTTVVARVRAVDIRTPADLLRLLAPCYMVVFDSRTCSLGKKSGRQKAAASR